MLHSHSARIRPGRRNMRRQEANATNRLPITTRHMPSASDPACCRFFFSLSHTSNSSPATARSPPDAPRIHFRDHAGWLPRCVCRPQSLADTTPRHGPPCCGGTGPALSPPTTCTPPTIAPLPHRTRDRCHEDLGPGRVLPVPDPPSGRRPWSPPPVLVAPKAKQPKRGRWSGQ